MYNPFFPGYGGGPGGYPQMPRSGYGAPAAATQHSLKNIRIISSAEQLHGYIKSGQAVICDFSADWCQPSRQIEPYFDKLAGDNPSIICCQVNVDHHKLLMSQYSIECMPTFVFFKFGKELRHLRFSGAVSTTLRDNLIALVKTENENTLEHVGKYNNLGKNAYLQGNVVAALQHYMRGLEILDDIKANYYDSIKDKMGEWDDWYVKLNNNVGLMCLKLGKYNDCIIYCNKVVIKDNQNIKALNRLGDAYYKLNNFKKAKEYYSKYLKYDPDSVEIKNKWKKLKALLGKRGDNDCPGKHGLKPFFTPNYTFRCDICKKTQTKSATMFGCRVCNYDLCESCVDHQGDKNSNNKMETNHSQYKPQNNNAVNDPLRNAVSNSNEDSKENEVAAQEGNQFFEKITKLEEEIGSLKEINTALASKLKQYETGDNNKYNNGNNNSGLMDDFADPDKEDVSVMSNQVIVSEMKECDLFEEFFYGKLMVNYQNKVNNKDNDNDNDNGNGNNGKHEIAVKYYNKFVECNYNNFDSLFGILNEYESDDGENLLKSEILMKSIDARQCYNKIKQCKLFIDWLNSIQMNIYKNVFLANKIYDFDSFYVKCSNVKNIFSIINKHDSDGNSKTDATIIFTHSPLYLKRNAINFNANEGTNDEDGDLIAPGAPGVPAAAADMGGNNAIGNGLKAPEMSQDGSLNVNANAVNAPLLMMPDNVNDAMNALADAIVGINEIDPEGANFN